MPETNRSDTVVRTSRGLSVAGTRITLYQIMDYIKAGYPPEVIRDDFRLTIRQTADVMNYIHTHYDEVDKEYQRIVAQAEEIRRYWNERNKERFAQIAALPRKPEHKEIWDILDERKARREAQNDQDTD
jgi:uncharacterized protein (DUF433 family)